MAWEREIASPPHQSPGQRNTPATSGILRTIEIISRQKGGETMARHHEM